MRIKGLQKLTLLDYKGYLASTVFTGSCNLRCPFCHNKDLVLYPDTVSDIAEEEVLQFLKERRGRLDAVCISGGEPTLQDTLPAFLERIHSMDYKIKLDTNGTRPFMLRQLINDGLVDYIAMDIKNSKDKYALTAGHLNLSLTDIERSIEYIMQSSCPYEFRTTVVRQLHTKEDILSICEWIQGASAYYLQPYHESEQVIHPVYSSYSIEELKQFVAIGKRYVSNCEIIG